jgi:hypothetical protein
MKFILNLEGTNNGANFLENYIGQIVVIESLFQNISVNSPPIADLITEDGKKHSLQLIDVRFIKDFIFIHGFVMKQDDKSGGKALLRLTPHVDLAKIINPNSNAGIA